MLIPSPPCTNRYILQSFSFFLLISLLAIIFFLKGRVLVPPLPLYTDITLQTPSLSPLLSPLSSQSAFPIYSADPPGYNPDGSSSRSPVSDPVSEIKFSSKGIGISGGGTLKEGVKWVERCDLFMGSWVKDEDHHPIYKPGTCPYVDEAFSCQGNGRPDSEYMKWRWKPDGCDLPRYVN